MLTSKAAAEADLMLDELSGRPPRHRGQRASSGWRFCNRRNLTFERTPARSPTDREDVSVASLPCMGLISTKWIVP